MKVTVLKLESGYVVSTQNTEGAFCIGDEYRTAETTLYGAISLAARALGYNGTIEFDTRTVTVPVMGMVPPNVGIPFDDEEPPLRAGTARPDDLL